MNDMNKNVYDVMFSNLVGNWLMNNDYLEDINEEGEEFADLKQMYINAHKGCDVLDDDTLFNYLLSTDIIDAVFSGDRKLKDTLDDIMPEWIIEHRVKTYEITMDIVQRVTVTVNATSETQATEYVYNNYLDILADNQPSNYSDLDVEIYDIDISDNAVFDPDYDATE